MKEIKGAYEGKGKKIAIVISRFNEFVGNELLGGCSDTLMKAGVDEKNITVVWAPGSFEIPQIINVMDAHHFDAIIALGVIIRGETPHFDYVASESAKGIAMLALQKKIPVLYGIITADTTEQAIERAGVKSGNKGRDAALAALEMITVCRQV